MIKFIYSEKATKILRNLPLFLTGTTTSQEKVEISQTFCGLHRMYELYKNQLYRSESPDSAISISAVPDLVQFFSQNITIFKKNSNSAVSGGPKNLTNPGLPPHFSYLNLISLENFYLVKVPFFPESEIRFSNLPKKLF